MKKTLILGVLALALLVGAASFASATTATYASGAPGTVTVNANVNSKLALTVTTPDAGQVVDFGTVDPGTVTGGESVGLNVKSNKAYNLTKTINNPVGADAIVVTTTFANLAGEAKTPSKSYTDNYTLTVPFDATPGAHSATVVYTATQL